MIKKLDDAATEERERCASICDGMAIALRIANSQGWSNEQMKAGIAVAEWLRDEIMGKKIYTLLNLALASNDKCH